MSWTEIIRPGEFAVFAKHADTDVPCDSEGRPFVGADAATCLIFEAMAEARAFCEAAVERHPALRFDIFDAQGRVQPPLLTVLHAGRAAALETSPRQMRKRTAIAWSLIALGVPLILYAYLESSDREREILLPAFLGINMVIVAGRLFWMNLAIRETERAREGRLREVAAEERRNS